MFTGIIEEVGRVKGIRGGKLAISANVVIDGTKPGDSMAINGVCLTVISVQKDSFFADVVPETFRRTNLGALRTGDAVNLERPLRVGDRMGGHFVQGHIDCTGRVASLVPERSAILMRIISPAEIMPYIVEKGFIAVDGVSLTVIDLEASSFAISLVPYTGEHTNLGGRRNGDMVNLEVDVMGKYVERLLGRGGITREFLARHSFL